MQTATNALRAELQKHTISSVGWHELDHLLCFTSKAVILAWGAMPLRGVNHLLFFPTARFAWFNVKRRQNVVDKNCQVAATAQEDLSECSVLHLFIVSDEHQASWFVMCRDR